jgi:hypothetical protein
LPHIALHTLLLPVAVVDLVTVVVVAELVVF